jgi:hypothetical protein
MTFYSHPPVKACRIRWGMFNGAGVVLSAINAFESQDTPESRIVTKTKTGTLGGARQSKNPHPPRRSRRVGKVNSQGEDPPVATNPSCVGRGSCRCPCRYNHPSQLVQEM